MVSMSLSNYREKHLRKLSKIKLIFLALHYPHCVEYWAQGDIHLARDSFYRTNARLLRSHLDQEIPTFLWLDTKSIFAGYIV